MAGDYIAYPGTGGGGGGTGTVTSVALTVPSFLSVTGSPITTSGTFVVTLATETANKVFAGPTTGSAATPTFRSLVGADLPNPSSSTLGGVQSAAAVTHQWINSISTSGVPALSQPAFSDISGSVDPTQFPALTGDVTSSAGATATTVAKIQTKTVSGTTGTTNVVFSASPTLTGTITAAAATFSGNVIVSTASVSQAVFTDGTKILVSNAITGSGNVVMSAGPTLTGTITAAAANFSGAVAVSSTLKSGNYHIEPLEFDAGNSSTAQTIDWSNASSQKSTLTGSVTYTFSNPVSGGSYVLKVATGAGSFTVTWPGTVKWSGGTTPTVTATASKVDLFSFYYDGTDYFGTYSQNYTP